MKIRTFWTIVIKLLGIVLLLQVLYFIPQFLSMMPNLMMMNSNGGSVDAQFLVMIIVYLLLIIAFLVFVLWFLFIKTSWIIDKLHLDKDFDEEKIEINASYSAALGFVLAVVGGFWLINTLPDLCMEIVKAVRFKQEEGLMGLLSYSTLGFSYTPLIFDVIKMIIGYLLITNARNIANFIQKKNKDAETNIE